MVNPLLALYGLVIFLFPRRFVDFWEPFVFENPEDAEMRFWTIPIARLEALTFLAVAFDDDGSSRLATLLGLIGVPALLTPRRYLDAGLGLSYRNAEDISVKPWVLPLSRVFGLLFVAVGIRNLVGGRSENDRPVER